MSGEWHLAYTKGRPFRLLVDRLPFQISVWADESLEHWVNSRLSWAKMHPGVGFPDDSIVVANDKPKVIASESGSSAREVGDQHIPEPLDPFLVDGIQ